MSRSRSRSGHSGSSSNKFHLQPSRYHERRLQQHSTSRSFRLQSSSSRNLLNSSFSSRHNLRSSSSSVFTTANGGGNGHTRQGSASLLSQINMNRTRLGNSQSMVFRSPLMTKSRTTEFTSASQVYRKHRGAPIRKVRTTDVFHRPLSGANVRTHIESSVSADSRPASLSDSSSDSEVVSADLSHDSSDGARRRLSRNQLPGVSELHRSPLSKVPEVTSPPSSKILADNPSVKKMGAHNASPDDFESEAENSRSSSSSFGKHHSNGDSDSLNNDKQPSAADAAAAPPTHSRQSSAAVSVGSKVIEDLTRDNSGANYLQQTLTARTLASFDDSASDRHTTAESKTSDNISPPMQTRLPPPNSHAFPRTQLPHRASLPPTFMQSSVDTTAPEIDRGNSNTPPPHISNIFPDDRSESHFSTSHQSPAAAAAVRRKSSLAASPPDVLSSSGHQRKSSTSIGSPKLASASQVLSRHRGSSLVSPTQILARSPRGHSQLASASQIISPRSKAPLPRKNSRLSGSAQLPTRERASFMVSPARHERNSSLPLQSPTNASPLSSASYHISPHQRKSSFQSSAKHRKSMVSPHISPHQRNVSDPLVSPSKRSSLAAALAAHQRSSSAQIISKSKQHAANAARKSSLSHLRNSPQIPPHQHDARRQSALHPHSRKSSSPIVRGSLPRPVPPPVGKPTSGADARRRSSHQHRQQRRRQNSRSDRRARRRRQRELRFQRSIGDSGSESDDNSMSDESDGGISLPRMRPPPPSPDSHPLSAPPNPTPLGISSVENFSSFHETSSHLMSSTPKFDDGSGRRRRLSSAVPRGDRRRRRNESYDAAHELSSSSFSLSTRSSSLMIDYEQSDGRRRGTRDSFGEYESDTPVGSPTR